MERSGLGRGVWSASTHQHGRSLETREGRRGEGTNRSCRRSRIAPPAHTTRARARTPPDRTVVSRVVGWIDNTTIAIGSSARARLGGACGLCRVHSPAKGTGVATADDIAAACMLLSQTRATTGRSRSLQWRHRAGISGESRRFFFRSHSLWHKPTNQVPRMSNGKIDMRFPLFPLRSVRSVP